MTKAEISVGYDHWTADEILRAILPEEIIDEAPSSFTTVGHIAHMNLKDEYLPFKGLIGQVILDKNPNLKTVVNKTDSIDTTFRFFKMEVLAGEDNMIAEVVSARDNVGSSIGSTQRVNFALFFLPRL